MGHHLQGGEQERARFFGGYAGRGALGGEGREEGGTGHHVGGEGGRERRAAGAQAKKLPSRFCRQMAGAATERELT